MLNLPLKTVILLIGASATGKSTLAKKIETNLVSQLGKRGVTTISSDAIRCLLLGESADSRTSDIMMEYSKQAFELLEHLLVSNMSFPVSKDYIIIDSTGLNEDFRKSIINLTNQYRYNTIGILINLNKDDMLFFANKSSNPELTKRHHLRIQKDVMPNLHRKLYKEVVTLKSIKAMDSFEIVAEKDSYIYDVKNKNVAIIGDIHEQYTQLHDLVTKLKKDHSVKFEDIFLVGDYLDKNNNTVNTINLIYSLYKNGVKVVIGNHENYVYKRLFKGLKEDAVIDAKFSSLETLKTNEESANKFKEIFENSIPYAHIVRDKGRRIFVTHAPCKNIYLGKNDSISQREQRQFTYTGCDQAQLYDKLSYIKHDSDNCYPFHVFGHISNYDVVKYKNKICIDTSGNKLSAVVFNQSNPNKPINVSVDGVKSDKKYMSWKPTESLVLNISDSQQSFTSKFITSGARYISGTMAPSKADIDNMDIESLKLALKEFKNCESIVVQPKLMGSRAQFYMFKNNIDKCFFVSRNGYIVKKKELEEQKKLKSLIEQTYNKYNNKITYRDLVILDGELLPWSYLGSNLIEGTYKNIEVCLDEAVDFFNDANYIKLGGKVNTREGLNTFKEQLAYFGKSEDPYYEAFSILYKDGKEVYTNSSQYETAEELGFTGTLLVRSKDISNDKDVYNTIKDYFDKCTSQLRHEGVVIKPEFYSDEYPPYLKVRNKNYLTLVYGPYYNNPDNLKRLVKNKKTNKKLQLSKKEFSLGIEMLRATNDSEITNRVVKMLGCLESEQTLDPRL